jgi:hypothetical protein
MTKAALAVESLEDLESPFEIGSWLAGVAVGVGVGALIVLT